MEKVYLATTALEETWDNNADKIVFLGSQCKLYPKRESYKSDKYIDLQPLWDSQEKIEKAAFECQEIFEKKLTQMTKVYNEIFDIDEDELYYNKIFGYWLLDFINNMYDKYYSIKYAKSIYSDFYTSVLNENKYFVPHDYNEYVMNSIDDAYSFQLYSMVVRFLNISNVTIESKVNFYQNVLKKNNSTKQKILSIFSSGMNFLFQKKKIIITVPGFNDITIKEIIVLLIKSKFKIVFDNFDIQDSYFKKSNLERNQLRNLLNDFDEFDEILNEAISMNIPKVYYEYFLHYREIVKSDKKRESNVYFTSNAHYSSTYFMYKVAAEKKSKLLIMQHGGGYGIYKLNFGQYWEVKIADIFYSFGWNNKSNIKYLSPSKFVKKYFRKDNDNQILYISNTVSRYLRHFNGYGFFGDGLEELYINERIRFLNTLNKKIDIKIRMFPSDHYKLYEKQRIEINNFSNVYFDDYQKSFYESLLSCKLHVTDITMTTFLEALVFNIPTICFCPNLNNNMSDDSKYFLELLIKNNILFLDSKKAAEHINIIYNNIDSWWQSTEVQNAKDKFCFQYARNSENWVDEWLKEFNNILDENARD